jgi:hypothetical protein
MKYILFAILLLWVKNVKCQNTIKIFSENWKPIDSIRNINEGKISSDSLAQIENTEFEKQVTRFTLELVNRGILTYPYGILQYDLSSTYKILLLERNVNFNDYIRQGVDVGRLYYYTYYQIMFDHFESKYGKGFFEKVKMQADSLDKLNLGLTLPKINGANSNDRIKELVSKTITTIMLIEKVGNLFLKFKINKFNKVEGIEICKYAWHGLYTLENISNKYSQQLLVDMNSVKWKYATFKKKYIDKSVLFGFDESELRFCPFEK